VPNGIPDPCPDFEEAIPSVRRKRMEEGYPGVLQFLFLGHCMESKDLLTSVRILAEYCKQTKKSAILRGLEADVKIPVETLNPGDQAWFFAKGCRRRKKLTHCLKMTTLI